MNLARTEDGVQDQTGEPAEESQASEGTEQAEQDGAILIDVSKKYRSNRRPDVEIPGDKLWEGYGRGLLYDKLQSDHQKLQGQAQADVDKLSAAQERIAQYEANERMQKAIQEVGIGASAQKPVAQQQADDWLTPEEQLAGQPAAVPANANEIANRVDTVVREEMAQRLDGDEFDRRVDERVALLYNTDREKRESEVNRTRLATKIRSAKLASLKQSLPDISEDALAGIVGADTEYMAHLLNAADLSSQGPDYDQAAIQSFMDGEEKQKAGLDKRLSLMQQQAKITAERERQAELEQYSTGSIPSQEGEEENKSEFNWHEGEKKRVSALERAKKGMARLALLKNAGVK